MGMGDYPWNESHVATLKKGIVLGMNLIDTAESYDKGNSEIIVGKAIKGLREKVIICSKFASDHSSYKDVIKAAEGSLKRLQTDYIDIYQFHWHNPKVNMEETMEGLKMLKEQGKIRYIGVGNFYLGQLKEAEILGEISSFQTEYNLFDHFIEDKILPYCEEKKIITIACSPLDQGRIIPDDDEEKTKVFNAIAEKYDRTSAQIALNWLTMHPTVIAIPTVSEKHIEENAGASGFKISKEDFETISSLYSRKPTYAPVDKIEVSPDGQSNRMVYRTKSEALENKLGFIPSPSDLALYFSEHPEEDIKPVRLISDGKGGYSLVEGRIRYWAWVIAHNGQKPIPAYIRKKL